MFEVNTPILQKWIDESPADVNPDTFHRLSVKIDDWLSKVILLYLISIASNLKLHEFSIF